MRSVHRSSRSRSRSRGTGGDPEMFLLRGRLYVGALGAGPLARAGRLALVRSRPGRVPAGRRPGPASRGVA